MFLDDVDYLAWDLYYTRTMKADHTFMQAYSLCSFHPMHRLHKNLRICIIQDRKSRARSSYPRNSRSSSRCNLKRWRKQTKRTLKHFRSAPITVRALLREASLRAFLSRFANVLIMLYFKWCITFRSCLQPLLHYTLFIFILQYPCYPGIRSQVNA
jgi:hypothetical protein